MKYGKICNYSQLVGEEPYEGESIEEKVRRIVENKEPIKDGAPLIYTEKKDGVIPAYDVRTDRFDLAIMAMDAVNKAKIAKGMAAPPDTKQSNSEVDGGETSKQTGEVNTGNQSN